MVCIALHLYVKCYLQNQPPVLNDTVERGSLGMVADSASVLNVTIPWCKCGRNPD